MGFAVNSSSRDVVTALVVRRGRHVLLLDGYARAWRPEQIGNVATIEDEGANPPAVVRSDARIVEHPLGRAGREAVDDVTQAEVAVVAVRLVVEVYDEVARVGDLGRPAEGHGVAFL